MSQQMTRRALLRMIGLGTAGVVAAACQPEGPQVATVVTQVVKETVMQKEQVEVEKEVTRIVEKAVEAPRESVTLQYWDMQWGTALMAAVQTQMEIYNAANPYVDVEYTELSWGDYNQKFLSAIAAGTPPDVSGGGSGTPYNMHAQKEVLVLNDLYDRWKESGRFDDLTPWGQRVWFYEGDYIAVTWQIDARAVYYRKDVFEKAGLTPPTTHDELLATAEALTDREREYFGIVFPGKAGGYDTDQWFMMNLVQNGGYLFNEDGTPALDSEVFLETVKFMKKLQDVSGPEGLPSYGWDEIRRYYQQDSAAMIFNGGWFIGQLRTESPEIYENTGVLPPLVGSAPTAEPHIIGFYNPWFIFKQTKHPAEAIEFLDFMANPANLAIIYAADLGNKYGPYKSLTEHPMWAEEPMAGELNKQVTEVAVDYNWPYNSNPLFPLGMVLQNTILNPMYAGTVSPEEAVDLGIKEVQAAYEEWTKSQ